MQVIVGVASKEALPRNCGRILIGEITVRKKPNLIIVVSVIAMVLVLILPRWYYGTHTVTNTADIINAIHIATMLEIGVLGTIIGLTRKIDL